ncbi:hypothetical protein XMIN_256 [Xanthomonas citri pv. mangiferaeindicae LMG 941]|nr:hypothetical protein XMIN_256 [Xanthomonas citri pv. mangiferaeindicae LMG 941]
MVGGQGPCSQAADRPQVDFADGGWRGTCGAAPHPLASCAADDARIRRRDWIIPPPGLLIPSLRGL